MDKETINKNPDPLSEEEPPPLFTTWPRLYAFVLGSLVAYVFLMFLFTKVFE